jgi:hypothetical protein
MTYTPPNLTDNAGPALSAANIELWFQVVGDYAYQGMRSRWKTGRYFRPPGNQTTLALADNVLYLTPFWVAGPFDRFGGETTGAGEAGSLVNFAVYDDDGTGHPGALVLSSGTVDGATTGAVENTVSFSGTPGLYWIGAPVTAAATTRPTMRTTNTGASWWPSSTSASTVLLNNAVGPSAGSVTTLPDPAPSMTMKPWKMTARAQLFAHPLCQYRLEDGSECGVVAD